MQTMKLKCIPIAIIVCCLSLFNTVNAQKGASDGYVLSTISLEDNSVPDSFQQTPVFEDAGISCLLNSEWRLSKGSGYYKIVNTDDCMPGMREVSWKFFNVKGSNYFQFFRTSAVPGVPADPRIIYVCEVKSSAKEAFTLRYPILFADKPNAILFTFTKK
ncbi:MAG TPA: hypothetical protein VFW07_23630 [Parafilimonas sp.]|nr:hypothetical protein [Parafilimonas sp.]